MVDSSVKYLIPLLLAEHNVVVPDQPCYYFYAKMGESANKMCCDSHTQNIVSYLIHNDVYGCLIRMNAFLAIFWK